MSAAARRGGFWAALGEPRAIVSILILYCTIHFLIRLLLSPNFSLDEAEQMLFGQSLEWGYRFRQPPLITWLTWGTLSATDNSRLAFFLLKYIIMGLGLIAFFEAGRLIIRDTRLAALSTFGLLTTFVMGFMPHVDLMHTVLLATMLACYLWAGARALTFGRTRDYVLLGVVAGLGILSKYVFIVLPIALAIGVALTPRVRQRLKLWPLLLAALIAAIIVAPYAWWSYAHEYSLFALAKSVTKAHGPAFDPLQWLKGAGNLAVALIGFAVPLIIIFPFVYRRASMPLPQEAGDDNDRSWLNVLGIAMLAGIAIMLCAVFFVGTESFKPRWMHQALMPLPVWLFLRVKLAGADDRANRIFAIVAAVFALGVAVARPVIYFTDVSHCKTCREYWPMTAYAQSLQRSGFYQGTIVASTYDLGGSLRYVIPDSRVVTPGYPLSVFGQPKGGQCLIVWRGDKAMPADESNYVRDVLGAKIGTDAIRGDVMAQLVTARNRMDRLNYVLLTSGNGLCN